MHALILAALVVMQQWGGGASGAVCAAPSFGGSSFRPMYIQPEPAAVQRVVQREVRREIEHKGLRFTVVGVMEGDKIRWDRSRPENVDAMRDAMAARAVAAAKAIEAREARERERVAAMEAAAAEAAKAHAEEKKRAEAPKPAQNFGIDPSRIGRRVGYSGNVNEYGQEAGDRGKIFLTVIGEEADRQQIVNDFARHPSLAPFRDCVNFGAYNRGDWQVKDELGFHGDGKPTILIQQANGRVSWRAYDYSIGPEGLAAALRKADPSYNPKDDPGPENEKDSDPLGIPPLLLAAGAVVALLVIVPRRAAQ